MPPILIVGGGVIGLSIGWQLARHGHSVTILERGRVAEQASAKAAGMLAPFSEAGFEDEEKLALGEKGLSLYPRFLRELEEDTGEKVELEGQGTLFVAVDKNDREWLQWIYAFKEKQGLPLTWLTDEEVREKEPLLHPRLTCGIYLPTERQIHPEAMLRALQKAFCFCGGKIKENCEVRELKENHILAAGAWSAFLGAKIRPVKGQILTLSGLKLNHMIRSPRVYLASKSDGTLKIGATSEEKGFDETVTAGAVLALLQNAWEILPAIQELPLVSMDAGLRPTSRNDLPFINETTATGHGRAGFLLAPLTAYKMVELYASKAKWNRDPFEREDNLGRIVANEKYYS